ncbi:hypothetical protein [Pleionea sp. CnH1-48]|uniref:hypothetical protein n=1 Tax=Pleionea sp. CnH1-48 TaxID=2954494 RepID=UPI0020980CFF|nr:hypothetical protein [Pleionea sp. CnH1-48]MCO7223318.1 hypothetical protein [Pleionea sp. CnH1-48]
MQLVLDHHHLKVLTPHADQVTRIRSGVDHWATHQLPYALSNKLEQVIHPNIGYLCIQSVNIKLLIKTRNGLMQADIDRWADAIVDAILASLQVHQSDNIRRYQSEVDFLTQYIKHLLTHRRAVDWPYQPWFKSQLSVNENILQRLEHKASLLPQVFQQLQQEGLSIRLLQSFAPDESQRLLYALGAPSNPQLSLLAPLDLAEISEQSGRMLSALWPFQSSHWLLVLALQLWQQKGRALTDDEWNTLWSWLVIIRWAIREENAECLQELMQSDAIVVKDSQVRLLYEMSRQQQERKETFHYLLQQAQVLLRSHQALSHVYSADSQQKLTSDKPRVELRFGGLSLVLAALMRHPLAASFDGPFLWMMCCQAVPSELRPLAYSDNGLRSLCLGNVLWEEGQVIARRVLSSAAFETFCRFENIETDTDKPISEALTTAVLAVFAQYLNGFESTSEEGLFQHFIDYSAEVEISPKTLCCRIEKMPLSVVVSLSVLFNEQPRLPAWLDREWLIQWKS